MSIRQYQIGDEKGIVKLLDEVFSGWPKIDLDQSNVDYWKWLFIDNPLRTNNNIVAIGESHIIGSNLGYFRSIRVNGKQYLCCLSGGLAVHPDHRGKGLYTQMRDLKHKRHKVIQTDFTFSITINPQVIASLTRRGHQQFPFKIQKMTKIKDLRKHFAHSNTSFSASFQLSLKKFSRPQNSRSEASMISVTEVDLFGDDVDDLWNRVKRNHRFIMVRDKQNLDWRFMDSRGGNYTVLEARENENVVGYVVLLVNRVNSNYPVGYVVDLLADENRLDVVEALIYESDKYFSVNEVNVVNFISVKDHPYQDVLRKLGFFVVSFPHFIEFFARNDDSNTVSFSDALPEQVHFQFSDLDLF